MGHRSDGSHTSIGPISHLGRASSPQSVTATESDGLCYAALQEIPVPQDCNQFSQQLHGPVGGTLLGQYQLLGVMSERLCPFGMFQAFANELRQLVPPAPRPLRRYLATSARCRGSCWSWARMIRRLRSQQVQSCFDRRDCPCFRLRRQFRPFPTRPRVLRSCRSARCELADRHLGFPAPCDAATGFRPIQQQCDFIATRHVTWRE